MLSGTTCGHKYNNFLEIETVSMGDIEREYSRPEFMNASMGFTVEELLAELKNAKCEVSTGPQD
jgi:hypothetical protein